MATIRDAIVRPTKNITLQSKFREIILKNTKLEGVFLVIYI